MEVSSHSVVQNRIAGLEFAGGVFTNITHDHLDYHKTFDEYLKAKKRFFDTLSKDAFALSNADDKNGNVMLQNTKAQKRTYSLQKLADFRAKVIQNEFSGLQLNIDNSEVWCKLVGNFNAYNLLAIYATSILLGEEKMKVLSILSNLNPVEGRFEYFRSKNNITSVVDYAHTPDALSNVINTILKLKKADERLITVVGCGGDRDKTKRPVMAKIAAENSDIVILTSDNPRSEEPETIISEMEVGIRNEELGIRNNKVLSIVNRKEAIKTACMLAKAGDIILVAGKGHETYQEIKGVRYPFDDREILSELGFI
jgi:UDP-N-acetylmuramoyl-L-alanyl-D-glutamate--2,6-diaminopimelate ligase